MKNPFSKVRIFYSETITELKKSSWPDGKELRDSTLVVFVGIILMGVFVAISDFSLNEFVSYISQLVSHL